MPAIAERSPLKLTTGRWICTNCRDKASKAGNPGVYHISTTGNETCPVCGERRYEPEIDPAAHSEANRRLEVSLAAKGAA